MANSIIAQKLSHLLAKDENRVPKFEIDVTSYVWYFVRVWRFSVKDVKEMKLGTFWGLIKAINKETEKQPQ